MYLSQPRRFLGAQPEERSTLHVPIVYEQVAAEPQQWEYLVESIDTREQAILNVGRLNELGQQGWLLVSVLDERAGQQDTRVFYYFVRQRKR